jgi:peptide/nickel transport system permease protein
VTTAATDQVPSAKALASLPGRNRLRQVRQFARRKPLGFISLIVLVLFVLVAVLAPVLATHNPTAISAARLQPPGSEGHLLGTDGLGRDLLSRVVYGARISITVGLSAVIVSTSAALILGVIPGYMGGWVDMISQRFVDAIMAFPGLILLIALVAVFGSGVTQLILILGFVGCAGPARVFRSAAIGVKNNTYFEAAVSLGAKPQRIIVSHVVPNIFAPIMISVTISLGTIILAEAGLSFLGLGVPPPDSSWGNMLSVEGRRYMLTAPWIAITPGIAITLVVFAFNMLGDALRDVMDPRLRGR